MNDDPDNLIVDGIEETYDFILAHQIRELISLCDRSYYSSRATLAPIPWTSHYFPSSLQQPPPLYDPVLGRIEAAVNDDLDNLIVDGMEETYDFILAHNIRELIRLLNRADDTSRAALISRTAVVVPLRIL